MRQTISPFMQKFIKFFFIFMLLSVSVSLCAQDVPGIRDTIHSTALNETRDFHIVLPDDYKAGSRKRYDVLYVLDAEDDGHKITDIVHTEQGYGFLPSMIIVHILTIYWHDRDRDFTPSHIDSLPSSGGASRFLQFMQNELIPYITRKYPVSGYNTLYGHSLGGLFAWYSLLNAPDLFRSYIITDPSLWWDNGYMEQVIAKKLPNPLLNEKKLYIGSRDGEGMKDMHTDHMDTLLRRFAPGGLRWRSVHYPDETHFSLFYKTAWDGLKFTYRGYTGGFDLQPVSGTFVKGQPFRIFSYNPEMEGTVLRYTTDGSQPGITSPVMHQNITVNAPIIKIRAFAERPQYDTTIALQFTEGQPIIPLERPAEVEAGGFNYSYYEGTWDKLPDFAGLQPKLMGMAGKSFRVGYNVAKFPDANHFALLEEGYIEIKQSGYYTFSLNSDDGSRLYIGNKLIIDYDGLHARWASKTCMVSLQKGFYPLRLEYFQNQYDLFLELKYMPPGYSTLMMIPYDQQFHRIKQ